MSSKDTNPKDLVGSDKLPLHLWPATATALGSIGMLNGMLKYGRTNFRVAGVRASIYVDAAKRHLDAWFDGEEDDPDDGVPHLAAALACLAIIVDARAAGKLNDDRHYPGGYRALVSELTPHVKRLKVLHADKAPKQYSIADGAELAYGQEAREPVHSHGAEVPAVYRLPREDAQRLPRGYPGRVVLRPCEGPLGRVQVCPVAGVADEPGAD